MNQTVIAMLIFLVVIVLFALNKFPMAIVALGGMMAMMFTGCIDSATAMKEWGSATVLMVAPLFIIAGAFAKTTYLERISKTIAGKANGSTQKIVVAYVLLGLVVTQFLGTNTPAFMIVYPLMMATCREANISPSKVVMPVAVTVTCACAAIPTTTAISYSATYQGYMEAYGFPQYATFTAVDFCIAHAPVVVFTVLWSIFYAPKHMPDRGMAVLENFKPVDKKSAAALTPFQEKITLGAFVFTIVGTVFAKSLGLQPWMICMVFALIIIACGVLKHTEIFNNMGISMCALYVGSMGIANGLQGSGAAELIGQWMTSIIGDHPNAFLFGIILFTVPMLVSQVLVNSATGYIFVPIALIACQAIGCNPTGPMFLALFGAMTSFLTPMSNPVAPIMFEVGGYTIKDTLKVAPVFLVLVAVCTTLWINFFYPMY